MPACSAAAPAALAAYWHFLASPSIVSLPGVSALNSRGECVFYVFCLLMMGA